MQWVLVLSWYGILNKEHLSLELPVVYSAFAYKVDGE